MSVVGDSSGDMAMQAIWAQTGWTRLDDEGRSLGLGTVAKREQARIDKARDPAVEHHHQQHLLEL